MFQTKWYVSQYSVTQCLAKLSYLETDLLTGLLLYSFTQQPLLNYPCKTHKTNNAKKTDSKPLSVSINYTPRIRVWTRKYWTLLAQTLLRGGVREASSGTVIFAIHDLGAGQPYRQFGLMTHQRICLGPRKSQRTRVTSRSAVCSAGRGSIRGAEDPKPAGEPWFDWPSCPECPIPRSKSRPHWHAGGSCSPS